MSGGLEEQNHVANASNAPVELGRADAPNTIGQLAPEDIDVHLDSDVVSAPSSAPADADSDNLQRQNPFPGISNANGIDPARNDADLLRSDPSATLDTTEDTAISAQASEEYSPNLANASLSSPNTGAMPPKKFTSVNVNKMFLEKANPTSSPSLTSLVPAPPKQAASATSGPSITPRLNATQPLAASRLTSAKLAATKSQPAGWASSTPPAAKSAGFAAASGAQNVLNTSATGSTSNAISQQSPTPRFATALSTSSKRASSPQQSASPSIDQAVPPRASPSLRHTTLGSLNRTTSPAGSGSAASLAPWAKVKSGPGNARTVSFGNPDFPTAAEAAAAKRAQEEKEKAEAAEIAARNEQHLKNLERFRGASLGSGKHWDEIEDEDGGFLDDVVDFGDGKQYRIPTQREDAPSAETSDPVSKAERFRDISHDRSWPVKSAAPPVIDLPQPAAISAPRPGLHTATTPAAVAQAPTKRTVIKETIDLMPSAASISLDDPRSFQDSRYMPRGDRGIGGGGGWGTMRSRGDREAFDAGMQNRRDPRGQSEAVSTTGSASARGWGTLAARQQSLNPNAPKVESALSIDQQTSRAVDESPVTSPTIVSRPTRAESSVTTPMSTIPTQEPTSADRSIQQTRVEAPTVPTVPWQRSKGADQASATAPVNSASSVAAPTSLATPSAKQAPPPESDLRAGQASEMLSAAERARRRREEEEAQRNAERERARQKALAIEQRLQAEADARESANKAAKLAAEEEEKRREEEARAADEAAKKASAAKSTSTRLDDSWRPRILQSPEAQHRQNATQSSPATVKQSSLPSPSDEASSWRRTSGLVIEKVESGSRRADAAISPTQKKIGAGSVRQAHPESRRSQPTMANLDDVMGRIRGAIRDGNVPTDLQTPSNGTPGPRSEQVHPTVFSAEQPPQLLSNPERAQAKLEKAATDSTVGPAQSLAADGKEMRKERQARASAQDGNPSARLSTSSGQSTAQESSTTSAEPALEQPPVWNRFKVNIKRHLSEQHRPVVTMESETRGYLAQPPETLTWNPPLHGLSMRTLSRDDIFFPKKYRKGMVIASVQLPQESLTSAPPSELRVVNSPTATRPPQGSEAPIVSVKLPSKEPSANSSSTTSLPPQLTTNPLIPTEPASMRGRASGSATQSTGDLNARGRRDQENALYGFPAVSSQGLAPRASVFNPSTRAELDFGKTHSNSEGGLAFSPAAGRAASSGSRSPVSFTVNSDLDQGPLGRVITPRGPSAMGSAYGNSSRAATLGMSSSAIPRSAGQTPLLSSVSGVGASNTWGPSGFAFLDPPKAHPQNHADQGRIKDVWSKPAGDVRGAVAPSQNSLRDIGDDFLPATLSMTLNDLRAEDNNPLLSPRHRRDFGGAPVGAGAGRGTNSAPSSSPNFARSPGGQSTSNQPIGRQSQTGASLTTMPRGYELRTNVGVTENDDLSNAYGLKQPRFSQEVSEPSGPRLATSYGRSDEAVGFDPGTSWDHGSDAEFNPLLRSSASSQRQQQGQQSYGYSGNYGSFALDDGKQWNSGAQQGQSFSPSHFAGRSMKGQSGSGGTSAFNTGSRGPSAPRSYTPQLGSEAYGSTHRGSQYVDSSNHAFDPHTSGPVRSQSGNDRRMDERSHAFYPGSGQQRAGVEAYGKGWDSSLR